MDSAVSGMPDSFVRHVAGALRRLYDPPGLLRSPLIEWLIPPDPSPERRSQQLRALLLQTIASLSPAEGVSFRALSTRSAEAVHLHYVEGHTIEEVGRFLALSERQTYRDIRRGERDVATLLWQRRLSGAELSRQDTSETLHEEIGRLPRGLPRASLAEALDSAMVALTPLCRKLGVELDHDDADYTVRCDATALRQCLTALLSYAVQAGPSQGRVPVTTAASEHSLFLTVHRHPALESLAPLDNLLATVKGLAEAVGGALSQHIGQTTLQLELVLPLAPASILVIDDNEGLAQLIQRYLSDRSLEVTGTTEPEEALDIARANPPGAIVLDILMPGVDGWSLLAQFKADPVTRDVPVIVCSVFNDPGLAASLGAATFIAKPFTQRALLQALAPLGLL